MQIGYDDNYTDESFFEEMVINTNVVRRDLLKLRICVFRGSNFVCSVFIMLTLTKCHGFRKKLCMHGLTGILREDIKEARLVANPGCYPTTIQLPLVPLTKAKLIKHENIIIDAKSGVSGAGRGAKVANLYSEIAEGISSYGVTQNRHVPKIEQGLTDVAQSKVTVSFMPHLMPMIRGMR